MPTSGERVPEPEAASPEGEQGVEAKPSPRPAGSIKRGAELRRELVSKLPKLAVTGDSAGAMKVDPGAADLDADAFIGPLSALVSEGRG